MFFCLLIRTFLRQAVRVVDICVCTVYIAGECTDMEADWAPDQALTHGSHLQPLIVVYIIL